MLIKHALKYAEVFSLPIYSPNLINVCMPHLEEKHT